MNGILRGTGRYMERDDRWAGLRGAGRDERIKWNSSRRSSSANCNMLNGVRKWKTLQNCRDGAHGVIILLIYTMRTTENIGLHNSLGRSDTEDRMLKFRYSYIYITICTYIYSLNTSSRHKYRWHGSPATSRQGRSSHKERDDVVVAGLDGVPVRSHE